MHLELLYCPFGTESSLKNPFNADFQLTSLEKAIKSGTTEPTDDADLKRTTSQKKNVIVRGVLSVTVIAAEDLPAVDFMGKADPYVVLIMKKSETKVKTRVRFIFLVALITPVSFYFLILHFIGAHNTCLKKSLSF